MSHPVRYQEQGCLHFITFSVTGDRSISTTRQSEVFERELERVRWYGWFVTGYVVMPEHVHLLVIEPERRGSAPASL